MVGTLTENTLPLAALILRRLPDGGFAAREGGVYRPDATAWAILALAAAGWEEPALHAARARLAADQQLDGRLPLAPEHPEAFWPTPLAILAWQGASSFSAQQSKAVHFLLNNSGRHFPKKPDSPFGHDSTLKGWPWIDGTHSWVMPTSLAIIALTAAGSGGQARVEEAKRLLLDRQLPGGGWNYGNTTVFGQTLFPMPETTGAALTALAGQIAKAEVAASLAYLAKRVAEIRTPLSLCWGLWGLTAWEARPPAAAQWLKECWQRQDRYGTYDTVALALLALAWIARPGYCPILGSTRYSDSSANVLQENGLTI